MKCSECEEILVGLLDGNQSEPGRKQVLEHVSRCSKCKETFDSHQRIIKKLQTEGPVAPPPGFSSKIMGELNKQAPGSPGKKAALPSLTLVLVLSVGFLLPGGFFLNYLLDKSVTKTHSQPSNSGQVTVASESAIASMGTPIPDRHYASQSVTIDKTPE